VKKGGIMMQARSSRNWQGIDVSHWQGEIDWAQVKKAGIEFAFIKATEGSGYIDPKWKENADGAKAAGLQIGFYHFARFTSGKEAEAEGRHFIKTTASQQSDLPHVLDLEVTGGMDRAPLSQAAKIFLDNVAQETGREVMLYTNTNIARHHLTDALKEYPLWIAHYGVDRPGDNGIWDKWRVFQYSNKGEIPGIKGYVDLDEMAAEKQAAAKPSEKNSAAYATYTIKKGDTFWALENQFHLAHGSLQKANPGVSPEKLQIGQKIKIPENPDSKWYTIKKGDTFWALGEKNGWTHGTLQKLNPKIDPRRLAIGEKIRIP